MSYTADMCARASPTAPQVDAVLRDRVISLDRGRDATAARCEAVAARGRCGARGRGYAASMVAVVILGLAVACVILFAIARVVFGAPGAVVLTGVIGYCLGGPPGGGAGLVAGLVLALIVGPWKRPMTRWSEAAVAIDREHIQLSWGSTDEDRRPIARVAPAGAHSFTVQFIVDKVIEAAAVAAVTKELDFYLVENSEPDPWAYARYHCNTGANLYSPVHWGMVEPRDLRANEGVPQFDGLGEWIELGRARPDFRAVWDHAHAPTRAFVVACVALADLSGLGGTGSDERAWVFDCIATQPRAAVIARLGGGKVDARSVKVLERCEAAELRLEDWRALFSQLEDPRTRRALGHLATVTTTLVRQLASVPTSLRLPAVLGVLAVLAIDRAHWERFAAAIEQAGRARRPTLLRVARSVRTAADLWDLFYRYLDAALAASMEHHGPIDLGPRFLPLVDEHALHLEGQRMDNCLGRLVDRATRGQSAYFAWLGEPRATVELAAIDGQWVLGDVAGHANKPLDADTERAIRAAVAEVLGPSAVADRREATARSRGTGFEHCAAIGRREFAEPDRAALADELWSIHGRGLSPNKGAYVIVDTAGPCYLQCLADPGSTYFIELSSHRYAPEVGDHLTSEMVTLLETSGFEWPRGKANFRRILRVERHADCVELADFALGALHEMFGVKTIAELRRKVHIPIGDVERDALAQVEAMLRRR
jgi:hypothetical protein